MTPSPCLRCESEEPLPPNEGVTEVYAYAARVRLVTEGGVEKRLDIRRVERDRINGRLCSGCTVEFLAWLARSPRRSDEWHCAQCGANSWELSDEGSRCLGCFDEVGRDTRSGPRR